MSSSFPGWRNVGLCNPAGTTLVQRVGGEGSRAAREVSTAGACAWHWAWTWGTELTSERLHGDLCRESGGLRDRGCFSMVRVIPSSFRFTHSFLRRLRTTTEFNTCDRESLPFLSDLLKWLGINCLGSLHLLNNQIFRQHPPAYLNWHHSERAQNYASLHMMMKVPNSPSFKTLYAALTRCLHLQLVWNCSLLKTTRKALKI